MVLVLLLLLVALALVLLLTLLLVALALVLLLTLLVVALALVLLLTLLLVLGGGGTFGCVFAFSLRRRHFSSLWAALQCTFHFWQLAACTSQT